MNEDVNTSEQPWHLKVIIDNSKLGFIWF